MASPQIRLEFHWYVQLVSLYMLITVNGSLVLYRMLQSSAGNRAVPCRPVPVILSIMLNTVDIASWPAECCMASPETGLCPIGGCGPRWMTKGCPYLQVQQGLAIVPLGYLSAGPLLTVLHPCSCCTSAKMGYYPAVLSLQSTL